MSVDTDLDAQQRPDDLEPLDVEAGADDAGHADDVLDDDAGDLASVSLWEGDEGGPRPRAAARARDAAQAALHQRRTHPRDWKVLVEHERVLRGRLNDLFLELQVDRAREVAWKRQATSETGSKLPTLLYDAAWSREETLVLVHLRDRLRAGHAGGETRVFVDRDDVVDHVESFRPAHATDESGDEKRARNAVTSIVKAGLLIGAPGDDRFEISEAVEPLLPLELLQELLDALRRANGTAPAEPEDDDLFASADSGRDDAGERA